MDERPSVSPTVGQPRATAGDQQLREGRVLAERYEVRHSLGRGGMGEVWLAFDLRLRVEVALKALYFSSLDTTELLRREIRAAREVISPNVCRIFDLVDSGGMELLSMEYIDGMTLRQLLDERSPLELREAQEIAAQFLAGLEAIHAASLIHRDFKPSNVMITRTGRVVVMDFGLAKPMAAGSGSIAGTPPYMAPEQSRGEKIDSRTDLFAAAVVLTEMVDPDGVRESQKLEHLWTAVREQPPRIAETPWAPVLRRGLAHHPEDRYGSAAALARALEDVSLRFGRAEARSPYPGLLSFGEKDAEYFFGRESEVEAMWRKLAGPARILGLIGPSGAGKTSFLRAGLLAASPPGWRVILAAPGSRPFVALAQVLLPEIRSDAAAIDALLRFEEPDTAVSVVSRWRRTHDHVLVIVDQFEELFTLNPDEVQERFAGLLGRLALEADVHVLLSMRDDFLFHCQRIEALSPVFSELTALGPPAGAELRRALVQPALRCGYRFEDESLVDQILAEVEGGRGALPLMAFAVSQVWHKRDRDRGLLTRQAYQEIGGVGGALAQHAEATMERIGVERMQVVRELFRNLVTAQGTRAARDRSELLSVFPEPEREKVGEVLDSLVAARLLTSYEVKDST